MQTGRPLPTKRKVDVEDVVNAPDAVVVAPVDAVACRPVSASAPIAVKVEEDAHFAKPIAVRQMAFGELRRMAFG